MIIIVLLVLTGIRDDQTDAGYVAKEISRFVGSWVLVETKRDGEVKGEGLGGKTLFVFSADGTYVGKIGDSVIGKGTFKVVGKKSPGAVDWTSAGRQEYDGKFTKKYPSLGLYRFEGDQLTVVLRSEEKGAERPVGLEGKKGELVLRFRQQMKNK